MAGQLCRTQEAECFRALFEIEAYLRLIVRWELRGLVGRAWKGSVAKAVIEEARKRQQQEAGEGLIDSVESGFFCYLNLSELKDIALGPLWEKGFSRSWPAQDVVRSEFKKLIAIRNKIAHFRHVTEWDVEVVRRFAADIARWTRSYRVVREREVAWEAGAEPSPALLGRIAEHHLETLLERAKAWRGAGPEDVVGLGFLGNYLAVRIHKKAGAIDPSRLLGVLRAQDSVIAFARVGSFGGVVELLLPLVGDISDIESASFDFLECGVESVSALPSDELSEEYRLYRREGVIEHAVVVPDGFSSPWGRLGPGSSIRDAAQIPREPSLHAV